MGSLLAIPPEVDISTLGLSSRGKVIARAAQDYGIYIGDRGGTGGMTLLADLNATDIRWSEMWNDLQIIKNSLKWIANNAENAKGGGGTPRRALAPPLLGPSVLIAPANFRITQNAK
jgi:hypothetical protein